MSDYLLSVTNIRPAVYFVQRNGSDGLIKIGVTHAGARSRLMGLRVDARRPEGGRDPLELLLAVRGDEAHERCMHRRFATHRQYGEWFRPAEELLRFIGDARRDPSIVERAVDADDVSDAFAFDRNEVRQAVQRRREARALRATLDPSEVAAAQALDAWRMWRGPTHVASERPPSEIAMIAIAVALESAGYIAGIGTTSLGEALLARARRAGVL